MTFITRFISDYGTTILYTILTSVFAYLGVKVKILVDKYLNDRTKKEVARTVVQAIEQLYKNLHGEEKLNEALKAASDILNEKGITVTALELRMLIEAAVAEFNEAFKQTEISEYDFDEDCE